MFVCAEGIFKFKAKQWVTKKIFGSSILFPSRVIGLCQNLGIYNIFCDEARDKLSKWIMCFWKISKQIFECNPKKEKSALKKILGVELFLYLKSWIRNIGRSCHYPAHVQPVPPHHVIFFWLFHELKGQKVSKYLNYRSH